ncbi:heme exporter protein CcmD [Halomonas cupida]|uniref:Heme exporter protein D n=1 Tax=Halomonas cupida TaxID=44933 RepID=A0A1M7F9D2_9GAMM|nr:heme exporter protein CcmD [Halomonas cupida]GEN23460.1 hypothetical protein HCU01_14090 [Halomonas cupida]SHM00636.1 heme exporter protein D [Halomonas cupida]
MAFDSFSDWLAMGRHGVYVWTAWGVSLGLLALCVLLVRSEIRTVRRDLRRRIRRAAATNGGGQG